MIKFKPIHDPWNPLYRSIKMLKLSGAVLIQNYIIVLKSISNKQPTIFTNWLKVPTNFHNECYV